MKIVKSLNSGGERSDGLTEAHLGNMRAIYEDPEACAAWRMRMGLSKPPEAMQSAVRKVGIGWNDLGKAIARRPRANWEAEPARKLTPEELGAQYAANPVALSDAIRAQNAERIKGAA